MCRGKNVGGACQCVVPVMAERAGKFKWSSGSVFDLTVSGAQARTGRRQGGRGIKGMTRSKGAGAGLRNLFNVSLFSEQEPQLRMGL